MKAYATTSGTRRSVRGGGFTVIELISVIVILAVLSVAAVPALNSMQDTRGAMAARNLLRDLTFARQHALTTGTRTWVVFDAVAETWEVRAEDPATPGRANATVISDPATGQSYIATLDTNQYNGIQIVTVGFDANDEVGFTWLGEPINESETNLVAQGTVTLTGNHVVNVEVGTGYASYVAP